MAGKPGMHKKAALKEAEKPTPKVQGPEVQGNPSPAASQGADIKPQEGPEVQEAEKSIFDRPFVRDKLIRLKILPEEILSHVHYPAENLLILVTNAGQKHRILIPKEE